MEMWRPFNTSVLDMELTTLFHPKLQIGVCSAMLLYLVKNLS